MKILQRHFGKTPKLNHYEHRAINTIAHENPLLQPAFSDHVVKKLLESGLARQTIGGTLKLTDSGMSVASHNAMKVRK